MRKSETLIRIAEEIRRLTNPRGQARALSKDTGEINTRFGLDANPIKRNIAPKFSLGPGKRNVHRQTENTASSCPIGAFS